MGFLYEGFNIGTIIALVLLIAAMVGINEVSRRSKVLSLVVYCVLPVLLAVLIFADVLGSPSGKTWFGWVKVISALIGVWGFMAIRFTKLGGTKFATFFPLAILAINISEAVYKDFEVFAMYKTMQVDPAGLVVLGGPWNILNGIAGVFCILTLTGFMGIKVSKDKSRDMIWADMTWFYIVGYTLWNFAYTYNCVSTRSMYAGVSALIAAMVAEFIFKKGAWLQHRAQTLSLIAMFSLAFDYQQSAYFQIVPTYQESMWLLVSGVSFVFNLGIFIYMIYTIVKYKKNPLKEEIYTHTKYYQQTMDMNGL